MLGKKVEGRFSAARRRVTPARWSFRRGFGQVLLIGALEVHQLVVLDLEMASKGEEAVKTQLAATQVYLYEAVEKINAAGKEAIYSFTSGDEQKLLLMGLKRFARNEGINTKSLRREIASSLIAEGKYFFFHA
ncbi:MAG: hypothetical protein R6V72_15480 [Cyclobacterium sp.]|uniref:hypothetical protein n=1 Tax=Cyclobacterium sp. TaxID=1966343 RepID=UPI0039705BA7